MWEENPEMQATAIICRQFCEDKNWSLGNRIAAVVGHIAASHNGEFCGLIYLFDCVHISLVSALIMMSPKIKRNFARPPVLAEDKVPPSLGLRPPPVRCSEG
eukprot:TRINITY_DN2531_c0_g1_i6.p1 TRINITY_DN2531_c0_g1~~TRINITY_DN2531_c0_g1_i6.p1  ORF type:complete len:102 (+),score=15.12 TRINITY_DN2531_c0_g1_i6:210-515(+)